MRKISILLCLTLALGISLPGLPARAENYTYPDETQPDSGYIVKLKEQSEYSFSLMDLSELDEINDNALLYRAESLEEIDRLGGAVEYYEPDCPAELFGLTNDKYSDKQWCLDFLSADRAWSRGYDGEGVRVAVIDSGVFSMHEDFEDTDFDSGLNVINGSHDVTDLLGHGTMVCGVLAATSNNGLGVAGLCDKVTLVPIRCFDDQKLTGASYVVSAIYEAVDEYHCDVINLSLGMPTDLQSVREALDYAAKAGAIIVASVGNNGNSRLNYPAAYENVIGVASVNSRGRISSFSNRNRSVFVAAPGEELVVLSNRHESAYNISSGTSDSAPMVSAAAVMLKQLCPGADVEDFKRLLTASVRDAGSPGYDREYGYGILDLDAFTRELAGYVYADLEGHWAEESAGFCLGRGYFKGVSADSFAPESLMTRGMFVTLLNRISGEEPGAGGNRFTDVRSDSYCAGACAWGADRGIVLGDGDLFRPEDNVTREQMATFLYRFARYRSLEEGTQPSTNLNGFSDGAAISEYAREAMSWAVREGLMAGRDSGQLAPGGSATRAEAAALIERFVLKYGLD